MFSEDEYFLTLEYEILVDPDDFFKIWTNGSVAEQCINLGVTYSSVCKNDSDEMFISIGFKFKEKNQLIEFDKKLDNIINSQLKILENNNKIDILEKGKWKIVREHTIDTYQEKYINQSDDVYMFSTIKLESIEQFLQNISELSNLGYWSQERWWGIMESLDNDEYGFCIRIPKKHFQNTLKKYWETSHIWSNKLGIDMNKVNCIFYDIEFETMFNKMPGISKDSWSNIIKIF